MQNRMRNSLYMVCVVSVVVLLAWAIVGWPAFGSHKTYAKVVAVDVRSGRILWSSKDMSHIAQMQNPSVDDAAHTVSIVGYDEKSPCQWGQRGVTAVLDERTGRYLSRHDSGPPPAIPANDPAAPLDDGSVQVRDADAQWNVFINLDTRMIEFVSKTDYGTRRDVDLHRPLGQRPWNSVSAAFHNGVLYAAFSWDKSGGCGGGA
jgi:hypothetical protein